MVDISINIGISGYGNLGHGIECALKQHKDMKLNAIFTRRNPKQITPCFNVPVCHFSDIENWKNQIDVLIVCGKSTTDLPLQTIQLVKSFNIVDSFDKHTLIPKHFAKVNAVAKSSNKTGIISVGWDPGMFSLARLYGSSILPQGHHYTFWGKGISQGHSAAIRHIKGVKDARQYTIPSIEAVHSIQANQQPDLSIYKRHIRECFVVLEDGANAAKIEQQIKNMPDYFAHYHTIVHFISYEDLKRHHSEMSHGGTVFHSGTTGIHNEHHHLMEYHLKLDSNPEFTASIMLAYARAAYRLYQNRQYGCKTVFDIPPAYLSSKTTQQLQAELL